MVRLILPRLRFIAARSSADDDVGGRPKISGKLSAVPCEDRPFNGPNV